MTPTEETTLEEELALGLDKYVEQLQAISAQASKEYALEKVKLISPRMIIMCVRLVITSYDSHVCHICYHLL